MPNKHVVIDGYVTSTVTIAVCALLRSAISKLSLTREVLPDEFR